MTAISVTAEHIAKGEPGSCSHCPVALALADAFPESVWVWVGGVRAEVCDALGEIAEYTLPGEVEDFIGRLDDDGYGEPFTFDLDYPEARPAA